MKDLKIRMYASLIVLFLTILSLYSVVINDIQIINTISIIWLSVLIFSAAVVSSKSINSYFQAIKLQKLCKILLEKLEESEK